MALTERPEDPSAAPAAVLDTNAVLAWLAFADRRLAALAAAIETGRVRWLAAGRMREELAAVLSRSHFDRPPNPRERALTAFGRLTRTCSPPPAAGHGLICRDGDDQIFLDLAIAEGARWLVTRDKALLALQRRALLLGVAILLPEAWTQS